MELLFYKSIIKPTDNPSSITKECCTRALMAVGEINRIAKGLKGQHFSKVSQSCTYAEVTAQIYEHVSCADKLNHVGPSANANATLLYCGVSL
jgi:hypothetical protein